MKGSGTSAGSRAVFIVLFLVALSNYIDRHIMLVLFEPVKAEFGLTDTQLGLLGGLGFALFYATLGIPVAALADRADRGRIITVALALWSAMTAACGLAQSFAQLVVARIGVGIGEAGALPPAQSLIVDIFPPDRHGRMLSLYMATGAIGYFLCLTLGSALAAAYGWRTTFLAAGLAGLPLTLAAAVVLKDPRRSVPHPAAPAVHAEPLVGSWRTLMAKRSYRWLLVALVLQFAVSYGAFVFLVSFLMRTHGIPLADAGLMLGAVNAVSAISGGILGGVMIDRLTRNDPSWLARWPMLMFTTAAPLLIAGIGAGSLQIVIPAVGLAGLLVSAGVPTIFVILHRICGSARRATAVAIAFFFANLVGLGLGPLATGMLSDLFAAATGQDGLRPALMLMSTLLVPCAFAVRIAGRGAPDDAEA